MALLKPFGYSSKRTQLQIACFWSWFALTVVAHAWKWYSSKKLLEARALAEREVETGKAIGDGEAVEEEENRGSTDGSEDVEAPAAAAVASEGGAIANEG